MSRPDIWFSLVHAAQIYRRTVSELAVLRKLYCEAVLPAAGNLLFNSNCAGFAADMHLAQGSQLGENNLGAALVFACGIQLALSGLFNVMLGLEDPFARRGGRGQLDSVQVPEFHGRTSYK